MSERLRVLEIGSSVCAAHAAKLLGDHGADVVKVEPPTGDAARSRGPFPNGTADPEQSGLFLALNLNKRGIVLDLDSADASAELARLLQWADIVVHGYPRKQAEALALDQSSVRLSHPSLVVLAVTPFGHGGPYADFSAVELTVANAGGWANLCPSTHVDVDLPPLKVFGHQCALMAGIAAALAALAVSRDVRLTGVGEYIDFSEQAYVASVLEVGIPAYSYKGEVAARYHQRSLIPWRTFEAKDGPIFLVCVEQDQWERLVDFMGRPDWATLEIFEDQPQRAENQDMVHSFVQEFVSTWNAFDLYHEAQKHRICFAPVLTLSQLAENDHLRARDFFMSVTHPVNGTAEYLAPAVITRKGRGETRHAAPLLGQHTQEVASEAASASPRYVSAARPAGAPLDGIRIVDLTWVWAGTFGAMNLAHLGADVIRFESEIRPDLYRRLPVYPPDIEPGLNRSGMFNQWNQGKRSVAVDLGSARGIEIIKAFVAESDVVMQNFATGVMDRLGLGYDVLKAINPKIVVASISGYGQSGPYREYMGYGPAIPPLTGLSSVTGYIDGGPEEFGISMPDPTAGISAALAVMSALERRDRTGEGDHLDITLWETTGALAIEAWMQFVFDGSQPPRMGNRDPLMAPHGCFPCRGEDAWVSIACTNDSDWRALGSVIDPALVDDHRFATLGARKANEDALEILIGRWTADQDRWALTEQLQSLDVAAFPSMTCKDLVEDPHLCARGFIETLDHPEVGARAHAGIPWRFANRPNGVASAAPCLGADTESTLREVLGYGAQHIAELRSANVLV